MSKKKETNMHEKMRKHTFFLSKKSSRLEAIRQEVRQCAEMSTIHAVPNIARGKYLVVKMFMFICLLVSTGICVWFLVQAFTNYDVITTIRSSYVTSIAFPIVSF